MLLRFRPPAVLAKLGRAGFMLRSALRGALSISATYCRQSPISLRGIRTIRLAESARPDLSRHKQGTHGPLEIFNSSARSASVRKNVICRHLVAPGYLGNVVHFRFFPAYAIRGGRNQALTALAAKLARRSLFCSPIA